MIIGLYDADMSKYNHVPFNLELMKLASYYKGKRDIVSLSPDFLPNKFSKLYYRKDFYDGTFDPQLLRYDNINYGGRAFNNNKYIPFSEEIEMQKPDIYIYDKMQKTFSTNKHMESAFKLLHNSAHLRLSLDGENIWRLFDKQIDPNFKNFTLFLHDYDLNQIKDSDYCIKQLLKNKTQGAVQCGLAMKFPIQVSNADDLFKWIKFQPSSMFYSLQYNGLMEDEVFYEFIEQQLHTSISAQMEYHVTIDTNEKDFIENRLDRLYRQIVYSRTKRVRLQIVFEPNFFTDPLWEEVIQLINVYNNMTASMQIDHFKRMIKFDSMYSFACACKTKSRFKKDIFTKEKLQQLFFLVYQNDYKTFKDFYECHQVELKGGKFELC